MTTWSKNELRKIAAADELAYLAVPTKMRLTINGKAATMTLTQSETTRDFISLLPLTLTMNDLFGREKFARLPRAVSTDGKRTHTYEVGDVAYWSPGPDAAIFYRPDDEKIPAPGIIVIGKMDSGVVALDVPGSVRVTFERLEQVRRSAGRPSNGWK